MKRVLKIAGIVLAVLVGIVVLYVLVMTVTDYRPAEVEQVTPDRNAEDNLPVEQTLSIMTYNIGYGANGPDYDFFMDVGAKSWGVSREAVQSNIQGILSTLTDQAPDLMLIQEVDEQSTRSYSIDQRSALQTAFPEYASLFAINYKVLFVPIPITQPYGRVLGGIQTLSRYRVEPEAQRLALSGDMGWPASLASLDRCLLVTRLPTANGKHLVLINAHLSAYDSGGKSRKLQLELLSRVASEAYAQGDYVMIGGDWNHALPGTDPFAFATTEDWPDWLQPLPEDFAIEGFSWAVDAKVPTNRNTKTVYTPGENFRSVIDGFLVSDNIAVQSVANLDTGFAYSDHNPVNMEFVLLP